MFPVAQYETHENALPRLLAIGNFTKNGQCYASATTTRRISVFDSTLSPEQAKSFVNAGQKITCMASVRIKDQDCLVIGTDNSLQVFNVDQNSQVFSNLLTDGVYSVSIDSNIIYAGGNTEIYGYDYNGEETFWTVTGDIVSAMCIAEIGGVKSLLAASNDLKIVQFSGGESKREIRIHHKCIIMKTIEPEKFVAAFENGSVALYDKMQKIWNYATQNEIVGMDLIDFSGRKTKDVILACSEGDLSFLDISNGQVTKQETMDFRLAALGLVDFKGDGRNFLVVCGSNGSIRVFMPKGAEGLGQEAKQAFDLRQAQPKYIQEKAGLLMRRNELQGQITTPDTTKVPNGPPPGMKGSYVLGKNLDEQCIELKIKTEPPTPIQATLVECPTTSGSNYIVFDINNPAQPVHKILLWLPTDVTGLMCVEAFVSGVVLPFNFEFQKFYGFGEVKNAKPSGYAEFTAKGDIFGQFVSKNFLSKNEPSGDFRLCFASVSELEPLVLSINGNIARVECDRVTTAARICSEFCDFCSLKEFSCTAHFPDDIEELMASVQQSGDLDDTKNVHRAEIAGLIQSVKDTIVRIENAEMVEQYKTLHSSVLECERLNSELSREHTKRMTNKNTIGSGNQKVNSMIQSFAELRRGNARNVLLQLTRNALQNKEHNKLPYILEFGHDIVSK
ncbi:hypothetical protein TVAG_370850 [Trichomonas vaginalis G3]|uniref:Bardet-Biedl syndrome 2 protein homolog n=1 Tax=Trichomonas vaginalis (strain ATCC PRA-98 / G3) TaxID=412133 RepID=A2FHN7_TRIV3|nr:Bardet-biedl syndrome protein 2 family [Trichomonas vaginalis G3]EAX95581.1 hypothetical protein TVAG_370850 [Trichomonas vaginalis G3]KAI5486919.1 Bardet-biedl syndrome protein 2 family [Trichomonas vaginalis G3]|eukprot:XP_001308511.1 hypothetical protein [Trichomonas vaginalis G3]